MELEKQIEKFIEDQREFTMEAIMVNEISDFATLPALNDQGRKLHQDQETQTEIEEQRENILKDLSSNALLVNEQKQKKGPASRRKVEAKVPGVK